MALSNLGTLSESLQDAATRGAGEQRAEGAAVGTLRARERIVKEEANRLQAVLQHPQYQADPLAAINNHLEATLPPRPRPPPFRKAKRQGPRQQRLAKKLKKQQMEAEQRANEMAT